MALQWQCWLPFEGLHRDPVYTDGGSCLGSFLGGNCPSFGAICIPVQLGTTGRNQERRRQDTSWRSEVTSPTLALRRQPELPEPRTERVAGLRFSRSELALVPVQAPSQVQGPVPRTQSTPSKGHQLLAQLRHGKGAPFLSETRHHLSGKFSAHPRARLHSEEALAPGFLHPPARGNTQQSLAHCHSIPLATVPVLTQPAAMTRLSLLKLTLTASPLAPIAHLRLRIQEVEVRRYFPFDKARYTEAA